MTQKPSASNDDANLATAVRDIAFQAHRLLQNPATPPDQFSKIQRRISFLRHQFPLSTGSDLGRWLQSLEDRLEHRTARAGALGGRVRAATHRRRLTRTTA